MLRKRNWVMYTVFLAPALILYALVFAYPVVRTVAMSFFDIETVNEPLEWFYGLNNYLNAFSKDLFRTSLWNIIKLWAVGGVAVMALALIFAVILTSGVRFKRSFRSIIYLPNVISAVAMGTMWLNYVYDIDFGLFNQVITFFGGEKVPWTGPDMMFWSMLIAYCFGMVGYHMLIFISGIERIGIDYYEAARIEGANVFQQFFRITLPLLKGVVRSNIVIWTVSSAGFFVWGQLFSPHNLSVDTVTPVNYMYEMLFGSSGAGVVVRDAGMGAAIGVVMALFVVFVFFATQLIVRGDDVEL